MKLTEFEDSAIRFILLREAPELSNHVDMLSVSKRERMGVGMYVNFRYHATPHAIYSVSEATLGKSVFVKASGVKGGLGLMLYIDNGMISMLEIFCHGNEDFPEEIDCSEFSYLA